MGMSMLAVQSDAIDRVRQWERSQEGYAKDSGIPFIFFESPENGHDYGTEEKPDVELEIVECPDGKSGYRRGMLLIKPTGQVVNRSYLDLPDFNK